MLLAAVAGGDTEAVSALVRRHQAAVYGVTRSVLGEPAAAEEAAQEAFVRAWRFAGSFDPSRGRAVAWLMTIARNVALDLRRRQGRSVPVDMDVLAHRLPPAADRHGPESAAERSFEAERVRHAVGALPDHLRRPLVLASWHGASASEIATIEGIPLGTAKTRLRAAMRRLRDQLEAELPA